MVRRWVIAAALAAWAALSAAPAPAQEIFWDGFDQGDLCAWSNPPVTITSETEAFDQSGANDDPNSAQLIGRCAIVEGTIGDPFDPPPPDFLLSDIDFYEIGIKGPALLRVTLERIGGSSLFQPFAHFENSSQFRDFGTTQPGVPSNDPASISREIYIPENGFQYLDPPDKFQGTKNLPQNNKWSIAVEDDRNYSDITCPCGGQTDTYRLTLRIEPVAGAPVALPYSEVPVTMPADGTLLVYRLDGAAVPSIQKAETIIDQLNPRLTDLDTKLYLVRKAGNQLATVAGDDDWDFDQLGNLVHTDSKIENVALTANPHFVIVDYFGKLVADPVDLALTIQFPLSFLP